MGVFGAVQAWRERLLHSYGRKLGLAHAAAARLELLAGRFDAFLDLDWQRVGRLIFVCSGNICRSPYAEARASATGMNASSFGLRTSGGATANPVAARVARERGVDLSAHRSRPPSALVLGDGDLLAAMEPAQARELGPLVRGARAQATLLGLWCLPARPHLEDPFGLSEAYFWTCFERIDQAVAGILGRIRRAAPPRAAQEAKPA